MRELKLQSENTIVDIPELNQFRIGDAVIADECADCDRHEGIVIGIELQRIHGSNYLQPSITLLHDGYVTDGFKPMHLRKVETPPPAPNLLGKKHTGMKVDYRGLLNSARRGLRREPGIAEMLRQLEEHMTELGQRWYTGDSAVVDELLQLYCIESDARAALAASEGSTDA